jgi:hypothetical protein
VARHASSGRDNVHHHQFVGLHQGPSSSSRHSYQFRSLDCGPAVPHPKYPRRPFQEEYPWFDREEGWIKPSHIFGEENCQEI